MRYQPVMPSRQTDANLEFQDPPIESRLVIVVLIAFTLIAFLSLPRWG